MKRVISSVYNDRGYLSVSNRIHAEKVLALYTDAEIAYVKDALKNVRDNVEAEHLNKREERTLIRDWQIGAEEDRMMSGDEFEELYNALDILTPDF